VNTLLVLAVLLAAALWSAKGARRIRMPQVVGFVVAGVLVGPSVLGWVDQEAVRHLDVLSQVALAVIGFTIGGELRWPALRTLGRSILAIVPLEALGAFVLVGLGTWLVTGSPTLGLLLGALASATAPAGTVEVLREYKARGPMTTTLYAVVGLDDAASLIIFGFAMPVARALIVPAADGVDWGAVAAEPFIEIGASLLMGAVAGAVVVGLGRWVRSNEERLVLLLAVLCALAGAPAGWRISPILASMTAGTLVANVVPNDERRLRRSVLGWAQPLYLVFFALVGARLELSWGLVHRVGWLAGAYVALRTLGKAAGTYLGARVGRAAPAVRRFAWMGLLSQAGVAIGLAIFCYHELEGLGAEARALGQAIISTITLTTLIVQVLGPPLLREALKRAGESPVLAPKAPEQGAS